MDFWWSLLCYFRNASPVLFLMWQLVRMQIPSVLHLPYVLNSALGLYKHREADQQSPITTRLGNGMSSPWSWKSSISAIGTCESLLHLTSGGCGKWKWKSLSLVHGILQARILEWLSLSLLQGIVPTQGLNPALPHCRRILYQLSHQGSSWVNVGGSVILPPLKGKQGRKSWSILH